jgi:GTP 3',8-cyclase
MKIKTPQLRICVTPTCNLKCIYCRPEGEGNLGNLNEFMTKAEIIGIAKICGEVGFKHIKITGGEPLLRKDIFKIISGINKLNYFDNILLVTNGMQLEQKAIHLLESGIDEVTLSVDAADSKYYKHIRGGEYQKVLNGLTKCKNIGLKVRINSVIMRSNKNQIEPLLELASRMNASIKFLDLINLKSNAAHEQFWENEYYHFSKLIKELESLGGSFIGYEEAPGGIGGPLLEYKMNNGLQVVVKDATIGTYYSNDCLNCKYYPCQDALISLRITHDGKLKKCLVRNDNLKNILINFRKNNYPLVKGAIREEFNLLHTAKYYPQKWQP